MIHLLSYSALLIELAFFFFPFKSQVVKAAQGRVPVFLDGGVRRGTDVFKGLALGASGIFVRALTVPNLCDLKSLNL